MSSSDKYIEASDRAKQMVKENIAIDILVAAPCSISIRTLAWRYLADDVHSTAV